LEVWGKVIPRQGVVTYASPVEAFVTRNQAINVLLWSQSRDQDEFWTTNINWSMHFLKYWGGMATLCSFELP